MERMASCSNRVYLSALVLMVEKRSAMAPSGKSEATNGRGRFHLPSWRVSLLSPCITRAKFSLVVQPSGEQMLSAIHSIVIGFLPEAY